MGGGGGRGSTRANISWTVQAQLKVLVPIAEQIGLTLLCMGPAWGAHYPLGPPPYVCMYIYVGLLHKVHNWSDPESV
jgi:hypothetical protein